MSAPAKQALKDALEAGAQALDALHYLDRADELRTVKASLDSLVVLTEDEAEKVRVVLDAGSFDFMATLLRDKALALLSGSGRADREENE